MGAVKVSQLEEQACALPPADVCATCQAVDSSAAEGGKALPGSSGKQTAQSISDLSTEYAYVSDEDDEHLKTQEASPTATPDASTAPESPQAAEADYSPTANPSAYPEATCIIFDWDDTLLPTSFLGDVARVNSCSAFTTFGMASPVEAVPCQEALKEHAELVRRTLTSACELGHVAIVTSSVRPWVDRSADQHLPSLDVPRLLADLGIPVLYAPECWSPAMENMGMVEAYTACKRTVMEEFFRSACGDRPLAHAISVGDSPVEREALKQAVQRWDQPAAANERPLCKTIKFMGDPSLKQLSSELQATMAWMHRIVSHESDIDVAIDPWDDAESKLRAPFGPEAC